MSVYAVGPLQQLIVATIGLFSFRQA